MSNITDFLQTKISKSDLRIALRVLKEFKSNENSQEWLEIPFAAWAKLEQLQEYLEYLVNGKPLEEDTLEYIKSTQEGKDEGN